MGKRQKLTAAGAEYAKAVAAYRIAVTDCIDTDRMEALAVEKAKSVAKNRWHARRTKVLDRQRDAYETARAAWQRLLQSSLENPEDAAQVVSILSHGGGESNVTFR